MPRTTEPWGDDLDRLLESARRGEADSLDELAATAHFSRFHLSRLLKKHLGFSLRDFIAAAKVDRGIEALVDGHTVSRSQTEAGHDSASSFHRAFRRHTGVAPSRYRSDMRTLATHVMRRQAVDRPMVVLHRDFDPAEHQQRHTQTITIDGAKPGSALFAALHPDPLVKGTPMLGIAMFGTVEYAVSTIPDGRYFPMVVEVPRSGDVRCYFHMGRNRRQLQREPISFPLPEPATVALALREPVPSDPPITLNLPKLLADASSGGLDIEVW